MRYSKRGFGIVELLIAILIIGLLGTLVLPVYTNVVENRRAAEALNTIAKLKAGESAYKIKYGVYTTDIAQLDIEDVKTNDKEAVAAGQYWFYKIPIAKSDQYRIQASRSSRGAGKTNEEIFLDWSDVVGASWAGDHPGVPKHQ